MGDQQVSLAAVEEFIAAKHKRLRFPAWLEHQYERDYSRRRCLRLRANTLWTILVYNLFLVPDWLLCPDTVRIAAILHFGVVTPWFCFVAWLVGRETRPVIRESAAASIPIAIVAQILVIFVLTSSPDAGHYQYFILLTILFTNTIQRLPFPYAVAVSSSVVVAQALAIIFGEHMSISTGSVAIVTLSAAAYLTLTGNYYLERDTRRTYLHGLRDRLRHAEAKAAASRDALTDLGNRHLLAARIDDLWRHRDSGGVIAAIMIDIDQFKLFNDRYGHQAGDLCLKRIASCVLAELRSDADIAIRYGGEELLVLLPNSDIHDAVRVAERVRRLVEALGIPHEALGPRNAVTASFGVAAAPTATVSAPELIAAADAALYGAKRNGRNQVWPPLLREGDDPARRASAAVVSIMR
jgi:diguanylate cyclase (GGDEF)-like protein